MKFKGILLAAEVEGVRTRKDRTLGITLGTAELSAEQAGQIFGIQHRETVVYICVKGISEDEMSKVDAIDGEFKTKSQSQRIRNVLFKLWEQSPEDFKTFDQYYHFKTEKIIEHLKSKIEPS